MIPSAVSDAPARSDAMHGVHASRSTRVATRIGAPTNVSAANPKRTPPHQPFEPASPDRPQTPHDPVARRWSHPRTPKRKNTDRTTAERMRSGRMTNLFAGRDSVKGRAGLPVFPPHV